MLSSRAKGALLGAANVLVVATCTAAILERSSADAFWMIMFVAIVPGTAVGFGLGVLAERLERHRLLVLAGLALGLVVLLGVMCPSPRVIAVEKLILLASIPTIVAAAILELTTRRSASVPPTTHLVKGPIDRGIRLAFFNVLAIGVLLSIVAPPSRPGAVDVFVTVVSFGVIVAGPAGWFVGWIAGGLRWHRLGILGAVSFAMVALCGLLANDVFEGRVDDATCRMFVVLACIPTAFCVVLLERSTRPAPQVRLAEARALRASAPARPGSCS